MAITTYAELQTAMENFLARTDLTDRLPEFISIAEARMSRELEARSQEKRATATLVADDAFVSLPTDLRSIRMVKLNTTPTEVLEYYTPQILNELYSVVVLASLAPIQLLAVRLSLHLHLTVHTQQKLCIWKVCQIYLIATPLI